MTLDLDVRAQRKTAQNGPKIVKEAHKTNVYLTILGDVGLKKWGQFLDSGALSPIFGHLNMGTFGDFGLPLLEE